MIAISTGTPSNWAHQPKSFTLHIGTFLPDTVNFTFTFNDITFKVSPWLLEREDSNLQPSH